MTLTFYYIFIVQNPTPLSYVIDINFSTKMKKVSAFETLPVLSVIFSLLQRKNTTSPLPLKNLANRKTSRLVCCQFFITHARNWSESDRHPRISCRACATPRLIILRRRRKHLQQRSDSNIVRCGVEKSPSFYTT